MSGLAKASQVLVREMDQSGLPYSSEGHEPPSRGGASTAHAI